MIDYSFLSGIERRMIRTRIELLRTQLNPYLSKHAREEATDALFEEILAEFAEEEEAPDEA